MTHSFPSLHSSGIRYHLAKINGRRIKEPGQPRLIVEREGHHEQRIDEAHDHDDADERAIATASRPRRDCVEDVYEILAATNREDLKHRSAPAPSSDPVQIGRASCRERVCKDV